MKNFLRLAQGIDITPLLLAVSRRADLWAADTFLRHYPQGPFEDVETIFLRFPERVVFDDEDVAEQERKVALYKANQLPGYDQHESIDYPAYALFPQARELVLALMTRVAGVRLGRVMINKVRPGGRIFPHADSPEHANYWNNRLHVVLQSLPGNDFRCEDEHVHMQTGEVWWFDHRLEHEVVNNSADDRIHLLIDIRS
tara:strand:+ start:3443 stop:4039 length:597 start_codon:yes stop_codon:yes gene_type:complete